MAPYRACESRTTHITTEKQMSDITRLADGSGFSLGDIVLETTIGKRDGTPKTFQAKLSEFPPAAVESFLRYGFQRKFNDAVGGTDKFASFEKKIEAVESMMEAFKAGDIGRAHRVGVDPLVNECRIVLRSHLKKNNKALWATKKNDEPDDLNAWLDLIAAKRSNAWVIEAAQKALAAKRDAKAIGATQTVEL